MASATTTTMMQNLRSRLRNRGITAQMAAAGVTVALLAGAIAVLTMPHPPRLGSQTTGDETLAETVRGITGNDGYRGLSVALIEQGSVRYAGLGETGRGQRLSEDTAFELGSIPKVFTGMLLADSSLEPETTIATMLPDVEFESEEIAEATLADLAAHRSGLPRLRASIWSFVESWQANFTAGNPYGEGPEAIVEDATTASASNKGEVRYSNLGVAFLGLLLARDAGLSYDELVQSRLLGPLGMTDTVIADNSSELPSNRASGRQIRGIDAAPWFGTGWQGAGIGAWSTARDLGIFLEAMLDRSAPGVEAATPRFDSDEGEMIGFGWFTDFENGQELTWHNGGTGGFRTFIGYDAAADTGVVVLGNTNKPVDNIGRALLGFETTADSTSVVEIIMIVITVAFTFGAAGTLIAGRYTDRVSYLGDAASAVVLLLLARNLGAWDTVPVALWPLGAALAGFAAVVSAAQWSDLPAVLPGKRVRIAGAAVSLLVLGLLLYLLLA